MTSRAEAAEAAFGDFYLDEQSRLAGYCQRLLGDDSRSWDIAQEALVRTWMHWPKVENPRAYCYLIAVNLVKKAWREDARHRDRLHELARPEQEPGSHADAHAVRDLVEGLPRRLRIPTLLHYWADLPATEIAELLKRPDSTIRRRLMEARGTLAQRLEEGSRV